MFATRFRYYCNAYKHIIHVSYSVGHDNGHPGFSRTYVLRIRETIKIAKRADTRGFVPHTWRSVFSSYTRTYVNARVRVRVEGRDDSKRSNRFWRKRTGTGTGTVCVLKKFRGTTRSTSFGGRKIEFRATEKRSAGRHRSAGFTESSRTRERSTAALSDGMRVVTFRISKVVCTRYYYYPVQKIGSAPNHDRKTRFAGTTLVASTIWLFEPFCFFFFFVDISCARVTRPTL